MKRQSLPKLLKVGSRVYRIESWRERDAVRDNRYAETDHAERRIRIDESWSVAQTAESLIHEILHCVFRVWNLQTDDKEERFVEGLEAGLAAVWYDNPRLMQWIHDRIV